MARDLAIDLGTANTLVFARGDGIVLNEPSVVAMHERTGQIVAMGNEALTMIGRTSQSIVAVRPLRHGSITDFEITERMIAMLFQRAGVGRWSHPRALISVSSAITTVERRAVEEAALSAGARSVALIREPLAAAIGAGLPIDQPVGNCIIDVGGGTTEVAVISMGGVVAARAARVGGLDLDDAIQRWLRRDHEMAVGERIAEELKRELGSASPQKDEPKAEIRGRDLATGLPKTVTVSAEEVRAALDESIASMIEAVREALSESPPELAHDVIERGMVLTGGGGLLRGLDERIAAEVSIPVHLSDNPLETVALGAGHALASLDRLREHGMLIG
ncbi:MAG: rod shape-determining protein [Actinomycetota bacterium]